MKSIGSPLAAIFLVCCLGNAAARAQGLPTTKTQVLNSSDKALISNYVNKWAPQLEAENDRLVSAAKDQLLIPLRPTATRFFLAEYRETLRQPLQRAFESKQAENRLIVRLNVMIVAAALEDDGSIDLLIKGLKDPNPAVRYWAAQAIAGLTSRPSLAALQRDKLLVALPVAMEKEQIEPVLIQTVQALIGLTKDHAYAMTTLLQAIDKRVELHLVNPHLGIYAELEGLRAVRQPLVKLNKANPRAAHKPLRQFTLVATRYYTLAAIQLEQGKVPAIHRDDYYSLLELVDDVLPWAATELGKKTPQESKGTVGPFIENEEWDIISLRAVSWQQLLKNELGFKGEQVNLRSLENNEEK